MRPVIYQLYVRHFSNFKSDGEPWGSREQNGCGTFNAVNDAALKALAHMGVTHVWFTGVLRHATQTEHPDLPADPACAVKGIAGSPYAVTDYFDVDPDLADNPEARMAEFAALLERCRRWGMVPMMDFIPNHVSRCYRSELENFGEEDNTGVFFARDNAFYYLDPQHSDYALQLPQGEYTPEHGKGRVTGNNAATWAPSAHDWYETVKLNYGIDYRHGAHAAGMLPGLMSSLQYIPKTWRIMNRVLAYWQDMGVGGFRCDMAHMVPMPFWNWLISACRVRDEEVFFMAEAYNDHMKMSVGDVHAALLDAGFDAVYDGASYEKLRSCFSGGSWANDLDAMHNPENPLYGRGVRYVENHDEPRMASPLHWGGVGEQVMRAAMVAQYATSCGPVLVYNGQETAERADGPGGFGGDNGRTSIFDYTHLPRFQHWTNGGAYDGALLTPEEKALRDFTAALLPQLQHPALSKGLFYGLNWANRDTPDFGRLPGEKVSGHRLYAFLRHYRKAKSTVLVVCNLNPHEEAHAHIRIPAHAREWAGKKPGGCAFRNILSCEQETLLTTTDELETEGLALCIPPGGALLLEWN